jgi:acetoin utilization deacetylase AcuC-like enzyme
MGLTQSLPMSVSMDVYYTGEFVLPLPAGHRFPMAKYHMLRDRLVAEYVGIELKTASPATDGMLALAHTPEYIRELTSGSISAPAMREIGFPWTEVLVVPRSKTAWLRILQGARTTRMRTRAAGFVYSMTLPWPRG